MRILSLDIGSTIGWAVIDTKTEKVLSHGQCGYFDPLDDPGKRDWYATGRHGLYRSNIRHVVIEKPSGIRFKGSKSNIKDLITNAMRTAAWHMFYRALPRGRETHWTSDNRSKATRLTELAQLTGTKKEDWREHEADAAYLGLKWCRDNRARDCADREA